MLDIILWVVGGLLIGAIVIVELMARAPKGYQDDSGFHVGNPPPVDDGSRDEE